MNIYIDNNVWNYFFENDINLESYFPKNEFSLLITTHGRFEVQQMPDSCLDMKQYIETSLSLYVSVDGIFGFYDPSLPDNEQRVCGFDQGRFTSLEESSIRSELQIKYGTKKKRKETQILFQQEADIELASRSTQGVVITFDVKRGPLLEAKEKGGNVVMLSSNEASKLPVEQFMKKLLDAIKNKKI